MPITIATAVEIVADVKARLPHMAGITSIEKKGDQDTGWVWVKTTAKPPEEDRKILKEIGFIYSSKRKQWFHRAETVLNQRMGWSGFKKKPSNPKPKTTSANSHVSLGKQKPKAVASPPRPPKDVDDEFASRFGNMII